MADRFLDELEKARKLDLRISGRVLLYAAILVRMKAEILSSEALMHGDEKEEYEDHEVIPEEIDFSLLEVREDFEEEEVKDEVLKTLLSPRKKVRRFTTLKDLITELQNAENVEKRRKKRRKEVEEFAGKTLETPHEENIEETIIKVESELKRLFSRRTLLYFSEVVRGMSIEDKISYYLSILHLAFRKKIEVYQKKLYEEDIELKPCS